MPYKVRHPPPTLTQGYLNAYLLKVCMYYKRHTVTVYPVLRRLQASSFEKESLKRMNLHLHTVHKLI